MTKRRGKGAIVDLTGDLRGDADFLHCAVKGALDAVLEAEMTEALGAARRERTEARLGYRSAYCQRSLIARHSVLELLLLQDRADRFSRGLFERYQRSKKAVVGALPELYVRGVSTPKWKTVTEALYGHEFSPFSISQSNTSPHTVPTEFDRAVFLSDPGRPLRADPRRRCDRRPGGAGRGAGQLRELVELARFSAGPASARVG